MYVIKPNLAHKRQLILLRQFLVRQCDIMTAALCLGSFRLLQQNTIDQVITNNKHVFITILGPGESQIKVPTVSVFGKACLPASQTVICTSVLLWQKEQGSTQRPLLYGLQSRAFLTYHLSKVPLPKTLTLGIRLQCMNCEGTQIFIPKHCGRQNNDTSNCGCPHPNLWGL